MFVVNNYIIFINFYFKLNSFVVFLRPLSFILINLKYIMYSRQLEMNLKKIAFFPMYI